MERLHSPPHTPPHTPLSTPPSLILTPEEYNFMDEIIRFENEDIKMDCYLNFYTRIFLLLQKINNAPEVAVSKIGFLLFALYFWSEDYSSLSNKPLIFMKKECYNKYDFTQRPKVKITQQYLCFNVFIAKMCEVENKESFLIEWSSYSSHKKMLFGILVESCIAHSNDGIMKPIIKDSKDDALQQYLKDIYIGFEKDPRVIKTYFDCYHYAVEEEQKRVDDEFMTQPQKVIIPQPKKKSKKKSKTKSKVKIDDVHGKVDDSKVEVVEHPKSDDSGGDYTMVEVPTFQFTYLLKSQDYDLIKRDKIHITQPMCNVGDICESIFDDKMSGKYTNIFVRGVKVAHISYFHYSKDVYHFKIDNPAYYGLHVPHVPQQQYTVPFKFHIAPATGAITFAIRQIDNPHTEIKCPPHVIIMVRMSLERHVATLHTAVGRIVGGRYKLHRSRRCRHHCKSKRKRTIRRR